MFCEKSLWCITMNFIDYEQIFFFQRGNMWKTGEQSPSMWDRKLTEKIISNSIRRDLRPHYKWGLLGPSEAYPIKNLRQLLPCIMFLYLVVSASSVHAFFPRPSSISPMIWLILSLRSCPLDVLPMIVPSWCNLNRIFLLLWQHTPHGKSYAPRFLLCSFSYHHLHMLP